MDSDCIQQQGKAVPHIIMAAALTVWDLKESLFTKSFSGILTADLVTRAVATLLKIAQKAGSTSLSFSEKTSNP